MNLGKLKIFLGAYRKKILNPESGIILKWNKIFLYACLIAFFVDPLFFYLPSVIHRDRSSCMTTDSNLRIAVTVLRTFADFFYLLHMVLKFRMTYVSPTSRVFGKGELVTAPKEIAKRYFKSDFFIDLIASLPLPQIMIWFIMPAIRSYHADHTKIALVVIVLLQYIPRVYLIFPLSFGIIKTTGLVTKTAWAGAAYNLVLYMLASHILGALWYFLSVERHAMCWKSSCRREESSPMKCHLDYLDCGTSNDENRMEWELHTTVFSQCSPHEETFNYGIFANAITKNVISSVFPKKYFYCLCWGLQNLSSYGQSLKTTTFILETLFVIFIAIVGLVLFALLIGNMQTYLQSITVRLEEWRVKCRDTEELMKRLQLPQELQERVRNLLQYKWLATRGVNEESILQGLPADLRRDIQRHRYLDLVRRVPFFEKMGDQLVDAICERLASSICTQGTYIVREGDSVTEMLFIIRGALESSTTNGGEGFFTKTLRQGDFCGEELLSWASLPKSSMSLPSSTRTVKAITEVEAFVLRAGDLKFVANQFGQFRSKKLQRTFQYCSNQWRSWAARVIQTAWHRLKKQR